VITNHGAGKKEKKKAGGKDAIGKEREQRKID